MTLKERYDFILKNISKKPIGTFTIFEPVKQPDFFNDEAKYKELKGNYTFGIELTNKATNKDFEDYIKYALEYTGMDTMFNIDNLFDPDEEDDYD